MAGRYDVLSPPVLDIFANLQRLTSEANVSLSVCGEAASQPLEAMTLVGLGITALSMPASAILPIKAMLAELDLIAFRAVLSAVRRTPGAAASLRDPIAAWAREHGHSV